MKSLIAGCVAILWLIAAGASTPLDALQGLWEGESRIDWGHSFTIDGNSIASPGCSPMTFRVIRDQEGPERFWVVGPTPTVREIGIEVLPARAAMECDSVAPFMLVSIKPGETHGGSIATFKSGVFEDTPYNMMSLAKWGRKAQ